jgi:holo-[acyl-carrier protein] synthase
MIVGIGNDIVDLARIRRELGRDGAGIKAEVFTPGEISYCESQRYPERHFAARFAAKEALYKALGSGKVGAMSWLDIEVRRDNSGKPSISLSGATEAEASKRGANRIFVSLSHSGEYASASVVLESTDNATDK